MPTLSCLKKKIFISPSALYYEQLDDERFNILFNSFSVISGRHEGENERLKALKHRLWLGAPVAQWDKRWPTTEHTLSLSTSHRPDMTEILLKRSSIHPSFTADKASASRGNGTLDRQISRPALHPLPYGTPKLAKITCGKPSEEMITRMRVK